MNREERERMVDRLLNEALAPQEAQPRAGLEERILANLRAQPERRPWWRWMWVPALAAALIALAIGMRMSNQTRPAKPPQVAERQPSEPAPKIVPAPATRAAGVPQRAVAPPWSRPGLARQGGDVPRRRSGTIAAARATTPPSPRGDVFPSPAPLSEQEMLFYQFVRQSPGQAVLVAEMQAVERVRSQEFMETGSAPVTAPMR